MPGAFCSMAWICATSSHSSCVIASACDIRLAAENANFGLPEINVGSCAGITHMGRHLPQGLLRRMVFTGKPIGAQEAWRAGFVDSVFPLSDLGDAARTLADVIASKAPLALRMGKEALNRVEFLPVEDGYALEQGYSLRLLHTEDAREATRLREQVLAIVSHDLRNPLNSIQLAAKLLSTELPESRGREVHRRVAMIVRSADRMEHLIADLLADLCSP